MSDFTHIAWTDLETTGLHPEHDEILEVGIVLTDCDLNVLGEANWIVRPRTLDLVALHPAVRVMHTDNGLIDEITSAIAVEQLDPERYIKTYRSWNIKAVDLQVKNWIDDQLPADESWRVALGGSGVSHFDIRWIQRHMPFFNALLYRSTVDVGVVRRFIEMVVQRPDLVPAQHRDLSHRALDDARDHLAEAKFYRQLWRLTPVSGSAWQ